MKKAIVVLSMLVLAPQYAGATNIDSFNRYAWGENIGWIDFGSDLGNTEVTGSELNGYAYSSNTGWISLNCSNTENCDSVNYGVTNDGEGALNGYAWGENTGWIDFSGVSIDANGDFLGYAYSPNVGYVSFNCLNTGTCEDISFKVSTSWKKDTVATSTDGGDTATSTDSGNNSGSSKTRTGGRRTSSNNTSSAPAGTLSASEIIYPTTDQPEGSYLDGNRISSSTIDLYFGMTHPNVKKLQQLLNSLGYKLAESGPGSPGNETEYFGLLTKTALAKYQADNGIVPASGYFGPITRAFLALKGF
ncbi:MAG: hypothetical protein RLY49_502 [Candidatus Parcubacteria bacterium]|jgi:hypothetical protein